jgi:hypothetical protein
VIRIILVGAIILFSLGHAQAAQPCTAESKTCVVDGKPGEKFCINGHWTRCIVQDDGQPVPPGFDPRCSDRTAMGQFDCVIHRPAVNRHETGYPNVVFAPGDVVDVNADGCVQTGGWGSTWKRYVNPSGPKAGELYHGLIRIPTETITSGDLVRINSVIGRHLRVTGLGVPVSNLVLHLGYEDDNYSDNGYDSHDDGWQDQCKTNVSKGFDGGPAYVTITIYRGVSPEPPRSHFDFDVLSNSVDPNGLPYNPYWSWQLRPENNGKIPDTSLCHNFSERVFSPTHPIPWLEPSFADCTDQADQSTVDSRPDDLCRFGGVLSDSFAGHVNWFPVTVQGSAWWGDHGVDDDYTFTFISDEKGISDEPSHPLSVNGRKGLHVEFDAAETIEHFTTDEWKAFRNAVNDKNKELAKKLFDGHTILTGMFGLDGEHNLKSELHPLYAIATRRSNVGNPPGDDVWLIFVRNVGDEGFCSFLLWDAGFEDYTFRLPWLPGATSVDVNWSKTQFAGTAGTSGPTVAVRPPPATGAGVYVKFHLGSSRSSPFVEGALHLTWTGVVPPTGPPTPPPVESVLRSVEADEVDEVEHKIEAAIEQLPEPQRREVEKARANVGGPRPRVHRLAPGGPVLQIREPPVIQRIARHKAIKAGPAMHKLDADAALMQGLCAATNNAPAGLGDICNRVKR